MIAPKVATKIDQTLNPLTPAPPKRFTTNPPTNAPTMPIMMVTMMPPGSSPGMRLPGKERPSHEKTLAVGVLGVLVLLVGLRALTDR